MKAFSEYALEKMLDLYRNHPNEVGSELKKSDPATYASYQSTDCITYVLSVISYAFEKIGNTTAAKKVWTLGKYGTTLAQYLVNEHKWSGIYINPDVNHPVDWNSEHTYSAYLANKKCSYYGIGLDYKVTNYSVTPATHIAFKKLNKNKGVTTLDSSALLLWRRLSLVLGFLRVVCIHGCTQKVMSMRCIGNK